MNVSIQQNTLMCHSAMNNIQEKMKVDFRSNRHRYKHMKNGQQVKNILNVIEMLHLNRYYGTFERMNLGVLCAKRGMEFEFESTLTYVK